MTIRDLAVREALRTFIDACGQGHIQKVFAVGSYHFLGIGSSLLVFCSPKMRG